MISVSEYLSTLEGPPRDIMITLHDWLTEDLNLHSKMRYGVPFYDQHSWVCYLNPLKKGGVDLTFLRGARLSNASGILETRGRNMVASITIHSLDDMPFDAIDETMQEALKLDRELAHT